MFHHVLGSKHGIIWYNYNILWRYMYFWMGFPWFSHLKLGILMDSPRFSPRFSMRSPCRRQTATGRTRRTDAQMLCSIVLQGSDLSWHVQIGNAMPCQRSAYTLSVCMYRRAMHVFLFGSTCHEEPWTYHCYSLFSSHVRLFRFVRKMIKNVAVAWCDPSLIQQTSCSMNMSMVQSCSII